MTDPIADMLTRIRNSLAVHKETLIVPSSQLKKSLAELLSKEGLIKDYTENELPGNKKELSITLKYNKHGVPAIANLKKISKPSRRVYVSKNELPRVKNGYGVAVISTSKGLMTNIQAKDAGIGGEVLCEIY